MLTSRPSGIPPYKYSYQSDGQADIDAIAYELGDTMVKDFMKEYEGKTFTVTEYKNLPLMMGAKG